MTNSSRENATMHDTFAPLNVSTPAPAVSHSGLWIALAVLIVMFATALLGWAGISQYNVLLANEARIGAAWNQVIDQATQRADLVPGLVTVVRADIPQEDALFTQVSAARTRFSALAESARTGRNAQKLAQFQAAQSRLSELLGRLLLVADRDPALASAATFQALTGQLAGAENRLAYARQQYLDSLADFNLNLRRFPGNLIAQRAGLHAKLPVAPADDRLVRPAPLDQK